MAIHCLPELVDAIVFFVCSTGFVQSPNPRVVVCFVTEPNETACQITFYDSYRVALVGGISFLVICVCCRVFDGVTFCCSSVCYCSSPSDKTDSRLCAPKGVSWVRFAGFGPDVDLFQ